MNFPKSLDDDIRDLINNIEIQDVLVSESVVWSQICSSLDILGDTSDSLHTYTENKLEAHDKLALYVIHYGVLQLLYVQQDAIRTLAKALTGKLVQIPQEIERDIRYARNESIGHPTGGKIHKYSQIIRATMKYDNFEYLLYLEDSTEPQKIEVNLTKLIKRQHQWAELELSKVGEETKQKYLP